MFSTPKAISRLAITAVVGVMTTLGFCSAAQAQSAGWHSANNSEYYYSHVGILDASLGVSGDYYTNGSSITKWGSVYAYPNTYVPFTSYSGVSQSWRYKTSTSGYAYAQATWKFGLQTQWIELNVQTYTDSVSAYAYR